MSKGRITSHTLTNIVDRHVITATFALNVVNKAGDCDYDDIVSIAEVQSAINMFLGLKAAERCVDIDNQNGVSISEVQKTINSFLGL